MSNFDFDCTVNDLKVGASFSRGTSNGKPLVYTKIEEVGDTGCNWCYCRAESDGKYYPFHFDLPIYVVE